MRPSPFSPSEGTSLRIKQIPLGSRLDKHLEGSRLAGKTAAYENVMMTKERGSCSGLANATCRHNKTSGAIKTLGEEEEEEAEPPEGLLPGSPGGIDSTDVGLKLTFF